MQTGTQVEVDRRLDALGAVERELRQATAAKLAAVHSVVTGLGGDDTSIGGDAAVAEVACLLHVSHRSAQRLAADALAVCSRPYVFEALERGDVDLTRAKIIVALLDTEELQEQYEDLALFYAMDHTAYETKRWILGNLPDDPDAERAHEFDKRCVGVDHGTGGMSDFWAYLPTATAETLFSALDSLARAHHDPGDDRTLDQRRADAVAELLDQRVSVSTSVSIVLPVNRVGATVNGVPVRYSWAWQAALAGASSWSTMLAGPDGRIVDSAPAAYRIPDSLARIVRARDLHCRFPGCHVPAVRCDLDHTVPFPAGPTTADNLHCLCRRHHRLKHQTGWTVRNLGANHLEWTSPGGRSYTTRPPDAFDPGG